MLAVQMLAQKVAKGMTHACLLSARLNVHLKIRISRAIVLHRWRRRDSQMAVPTARLELAQTVHALNNHWGLF
jgi:hypothetical protein